MASEPGFKPALLVIDMQEDFCPPNGSLAVPDGRAVIPVINALLAAPTLAVRIATRDWHPADHISFASNHAGSKQPYVDTCTVVNPSNATETYETRLWPVHCVADTPGAQLAAGLDPRRIDRVLDKGTDARVEMYSAFYDPLRRPRVSDSGLADALRAADVTHVYVVGLAADYCVRSTAVDARAEGFVVYVVNEGTRPVDTAAWGQCRAELEAAGVRVVSKDGPEVRRLYGEAKV
ncbi:isochorismatase [Lasiosphaeria miniovina]|uniref:nicotinamidase n=1 Tax=Lasiosphaeria miniovina TaxID=1954250 RepID=A0AA40BIB2_9PEZI|nr:isochorismatase [Lasiosphaeria miniovina]KAK0734742.1 isochorismatase [Lasiosphaeria miniovina]